MPGLVPAEELQEVGFWLNLTNSGVVETTSELASVLAVLSVLDARSSVPCVIQCAIQESCTFAAFAAADQLLKEHV